MNQRLNGGSRFLVCVVATAMAFASTATCLAAVMQMPEMAQHASCHGMKTDSDSTKFMAAPQDCCAVPNAEVARLAATDPIVAAPTVALSTPSVIEPSPVRDTLGAALDPGIPKPSSSPTYLLVSVFRL